MRQYVCKQCGASLNFTEGKAVCDSCLTVWYRDNLEVELENLHTRLQEAFNDRDSKNTGRALQLRRLSDEVLKKYDSDDSLARFCSAAADALDGNGFKLEHLTRERNALEDDFSEFITKGIIELFDVRNKDDVQAMIERLYNGELRASLTKYLTTVFDQKRVFEANYHIGKRDVFISYSSKDQAVADYIVQYLESQGVTCWISSRNIRPGSPNYWEDIFEGIDDCRAVLALSCQNSMDSVDVRKELNYCARANKPLIELKLDSTPHNANFTALFGTRQWVTAYPDVTQPIKSNELLRVIRSAQTQARPTATTDNVSYAKINALTAEIEKLKHSKTQTVINVSSAVTGIEDIFAHLMALVSSEDYDRAVTALDQMQTIDSTHCATLAAAVAVYVALFTTGNSRDLTADSRRAVAAAHELISRYKTPSETETALYSRLSGEGRIALAFGFFKTKLFDRASFVFSSCSPTDYYSSVGQKRFAILASALYPDLLLPFYKNAHFECADYFIQTALESELPDSDRITLLQSLKGTPISRDCEEYINEYLAEDDEFNVKFALLTLLQGTELAVNAQHVVKAARSDERALELSLTAIEHSRLYSADVDELIASAIHIGTATAVLRTLQFLRDKRILNIGEQNIRAIVRFSDTVGADEYTVLSSLSNFIDDEKEREAAISESLECANAAGKIRAIGAANCKITYKCYRDYLLKSGNADKPATVRILLASTADYALDERLLTDYAKALPDSDEVLAEVSQALLRACKSTVDVNIVALLITKSGEYCNTILDTLSDSAKAQLLPALAKANAPSNACNVVSQLTAATPSNLEAALKSNMSPNALVNFVSRCTFLSRETLTAEVDTFMGKVRMNPFQACALRLCDCSRLNAVFKKADYKSPVVVNGEKRKIKDFLAMFPPNDPRGANLKKYI